MIFFTHFAQRLPLFKLIRFLVSGGTSAAVHIGVFIILTEIYSVWYVSATGIGFLLGFIVNFTLQKVWAFRNRSLARIHTQTVLFFSINIANFLLNAGLMILLVENFGLIPVIAQICAAAFVSLESFIVYSFIFRADDSGTTSIPHDKTH